MPPTTAPTTQFLLRPDWVDAATWLPQLAAHVRAPHAGTLHLDATGDDPPASVIHGMLVEVCEALCPDRPLPEIVLHDDLTELTGVAELPAPPVGPEAEGAPSELLARAVAVKRIADAARAHVERWRFERTAPVVSSQPLVTVRIPTWRGHETLVRRTLPSVLGGAYPQLEILVCSDGPDPAARAAVEAVAARDPRVRYLELPERPRYPQTKLDLHRVGGIDACNAVLDAARGDFICPLDHDDAFTHDHVVALLEAHARSGADFVYGRSLCELEHGVWAHNGFEPLRHGGLSHGSVMWSSRLAHMRYDRDAWILREPGDWNMFRRMSELGAAAAFIPSTILVHFAERTSIDSVDVVPPEATPAELLAELLATGAGWLLRTPLPHTPA
jgi:hypothetical protein